MYMLTHAEYMEKLAKLSISSLNLIEASSTIPLCTVLCKHQKCINYQIDRVQDSYEKQEF